MKSLTWHFSKLYHYNVFVLIPDLRQAPAFSWTARLNRWCSEKYFKHDMHKQCGTNFCYSLIWYNYYCLDQFGSKWRLFNFSVWRPHIWSMNRVRTLHYLFCIWIFGRLSITHACGVQQWLTARTEQHLPNKRNFTTIGKGLNALLRRRRDQRNSIFGMSSTRSNIIGNKDCLSIKSTTWNGLLL